MIPNELKQYDQWVCWKYITVDGRKTKMPVTPNAGKRARTNDSSTWGTYKDAVEMSKYYDGIGFVFTKDDPFVGIDIDHCLKDGKLEPYAADLIASCGSYTELSPSGTGIHIIGKGTLPHSSSGKRTALIEVYASTRFFTVTGDAYQEDLKDISDVQPVINSLFEEFFKTEVDKKGTRGVCSSAPIEPEPVSDSDIEFLEMVLFKQKDGDLLRSLFNGENPMYGGDRSKNDFYFCLKVNWANGNNLAQTDRIFRGSGRMRLKWDEVHYSNGDTYGQKLLRDAISQNPKQQWSFKKKGVR